MTNPEHTEERITMDYKKFVPCIYLYQGKAVQSFEDRTPVSLNPLELARFYSEHQADELLVFDLSNGDTEHEEALDIIKEICGSVQIPVIGAGNVKRMEDIKKLLYAGCKKGVLNYDKEENISITEEVSLKFGRDKIAATITTVERLEEQKALLADHVSEVINMNPLIFKEALEESPVPVLSMLPEVTLDKIIGILKQPNLSGLTGQLMNENAKEFSALKDVCAQNGILVGSSFMAAYAWKDFKCNSDGHVPVVVQDYKTGQVLMVAYMNEEAYNMTLRTGKMTYYSRSRQELWIKGETSGHYQYMKSLTADCDMDTILAKVAQEGAACHTGSYSCFFNEIIQKDYREEHNPLKVFQDVFAVIEDRKEHPKEGSYTNYLFDKGIDKILKKLGEEATEIVIAAKNPNPNEIKYEISDFLYHMMVLMAEKGVTWEEITEELAKR